LDFLSRLKEHMEGFIFTPSIIEIGMQKIDGNSVAIRPSPSNIDTRNMDKGKIYPFNFQVLSHHSESFKAYDLINRIFEEYDLPKTDLIIRSSNDSYELISCMCTSTPSYVETTNHGALWSAVFQAELYIK
jgi:hypothetical protein